MKKIPLTQGKFAIVDDVDYERLSKFKWYCHCGYARRMGDGKAIHMHREILSPPDGFIIDHANGNRLDNRRENIRICTFAQNTQNAERRSDNSSGYKGVSWHTNKKWRTQIIVNGKVTHVGMFSNIIDAARAYNEAAIKYYGEFAKLNEIPQESVSC